MIQTVGNSRPWLYPLHDLHPRLSKMDMLPAVVRLQSIHAESYAFDFVPRSYNDARSVKPRGANSKYRPKYNDLPYFYHENQLYAT